MAILKFKKFEDIDKLEKEGICQYFHLQESSRRSLINRIDNISF